MGNMIAFFHLVAVFRADPGWTDDVPGHSLLVMKRDGMFHFQRKAKGWRTTTKYIVAIVGCVSPKLLVNTLTQRCCVGNFN